MLEVVVGILSAAMVLILLALAVVAGIWWTRRTTGKPPTGLKRLQLSDGHWAQVRPRLTQAMWNALVASRPANIEQDDNGRIIDASGTDVTDLVGDMVMRALILSGVAEWSYGEVDEDVLSEAVPLDDQQTLSDYLDGVLSSSPMWRRATSGI